MTTTMTPMTPAPAWTGSLAVRPATCPAPLAGARLRALPFVAVDPVDAFAVAVAPTGGRPAGTGASGAAVRVASSGTSAQHQHRNDGTTLGIHRPGRPLS